MTNKRIKILHVTSSLKIGGAERVLCDLVRALKNEFDQSIAYFHHGPMYDEIKSCKIPMYKVKGHLSQYDPSFFYSLACIVKKVKPDIIHSSLWMANIASIIVGKFLRVPTIISLHNNLEQDGSLRNIISKLCLPFSKKVVAVSNEVASGYQNRFGYRPLVIKNGVDIKSLNKKALDEPVSRESIGLCARNFIIGSVGRFEPVKNYKLLLLASAKVIKKFDYVRLVLVGIGSQEAQLRKLAKDLSIANSVIFIIGQSSYKYFPLFDCFALSSAQEGISIALLEAMALGIAPVITNISCLHDVIENGVDGLIAPAGDIDVLAALIEKIIKDCSLRSLIAQNAEKTIQNKFSTDMMIEKYKQIYRKIYK